MSDPFVFIFLFFLFRLKKKEIAAAFACCCLLCGTDDSEEGRCGSKSKSTSRRRLQTFVLFQQLGLALDTALFCGVRSRAANFLMIFHNIILYNNYCILLRK